MAKTKTWDRLALTVMRVGVGFILVAHGWQKIANLEQTQAGFAQMGLEPWMVFLSIAGEFLGGLGLMVGLLGRIAALGIACNMAVAIVAAHISNGLFAKNGGFEYPLTLLLVALFFVAHGAGAWSLDALIAKAKKSKNKSDAKVDRITEAGMESFPASDPPAYTPREANT